MIDPMGLDSAAICHLIQNLPHDVVNLDKPIHTGNLESLAEAGNNARYMLEHGALYATLLY